MKAKRVLFVLLASMLVLLAFAPAAAAAAYERPFKFMASGEVYFGPGSVFGLPENPNPPYVYTVTFAQGNASHLGLTSAFSYHPTPTGNDIAGGQMVLTAANSDEVFVEYDGYAPYPVPGVPSIIPIDGDFTIVGGTGRFDGGTGSGQFVAYVQFPGEFNPGPWYGTWYWSGTIGY